MKSSQKSSRPEAVFDDRLLRQLKTYESQATVDRAWQRLSRSPSVVLAHSVSSRRPAVRALTSAALVCAGVLLGMYFERSTGVKQTFTVQSEALAPRTGAASSVNETESSVSQGETHRSSKGGSKSKVPVSSPSKRRQLGAEDHGSAQADNSMEPEVDESAQPETPVVIVPAKAEWMLLAERGDFAGAFQELDQRGGFDQALLSAGPDELMTLVDVARAVGRQGRAVQALRIVLDQYRDDENAPLAAMMLGNLLSRTGDASGAAEAFALNRRLSPGGDFAEDALVREFDMAITAMNLAEAERLRAQYEREYPEGRHQDALRADLDRLASELSDTNESSDYDESSAFDESGDYEGEVVAEEPITEETAGPGAPAGDNQRVVDPPAVQRDSTQSEAN